MGCERGARCHNGKGCRADENKCPTGCSYAECLQHARLHNSEGFAFRSMLFEEPFCKLCTKEKLESPQIIANSGIYIKQGKCKNN